jgi:hypothetical protein
MSVEYNFDSLVGKTITSVEHYVSERLNGLTQVKLTFSDGDELDLGSRGCDEGGWIEVSGSNYDVN